MLVNRTGIKTTVNLYLNYYIKICLAFFFMSLGSYHAIAQADSTLERAQNMVLIKDYKKATELFGKAYDQAPGNADVYHDYLEVLILQKDFKRAEELIGKQQRYQNNSLLQIDLGRVLLASGKEKKALELFDAAINSINGDDMMIRRMATSFTEMGRDDYALKVYERAHKLFQNPYMYSGPISRLYAKTGATEKAVDAILDGAMGQPGGIEEVKATLLEVLGDDPKKLQSGQKAIIRRINQQPESTYFSEILTWLYTQKGDWDGALLQLQAIDARNRESGNRLLEFARLAARQQQYAVALKSIETVLEKTKENPLYPSARMLKLDISMEQLEDNINYTKDDVTRLSGEFESFFSELPQYNTSNSMRDYAALEARYNNNPKKAIQLLKSALTQPNISRDFMGNAKLELGDYQILDGKVWEASLTYSQVDKAFREDMLGEEARFRNAKLAYYRGDFDWAQGQLTVLKASTSELIANDALSLSVLITENTPDSNYAPLLAYARADLLLFQNKDTLASRLLDSVAKAFPKHTLNDDILMLRSDIAVKKRDYTTALAYLKEVYEKYDKDVLADDALFKTAVIYDEYLKKPEAALKFYEQLVIDYPGSTYVQTARQRIQKGPANAAPAPL